MSSKFTNNFKRTDLDEKEAFRAKVIQVLTEKFPDLTFTKGVDSDQILTGELTLGLTNLRSKFLLTSQTSKDLENLAEEQFGLLYQTFEHLKKSDFQKTWDEVKSLLVLQIMPLEYSLKFTALHFPLGEDVVIGVVIDDEKSYRYVTENDVKTWNLSPEEIYRAAEENLVEKTQGIAMTIIPKPLGLAVINTMDSFDAARILLPQIREFFAEQIGKPFYFGIPNRDFLICFPADSDDESYQNYSSQIAEDNSERPYPLSPNIFIVDGKNEIKQVTFSKTKSNHQINLN